MPPFDSADYEIGFAPASPAPILPAQPLSRQEKGPILQHLIVARSRIDEPHLWCKGALSRGASRCIMGALIGSTDEDPFGNAAPRSPHYQGAWEALVDKLGHMDVPRFNNAPDTTHADVLALFDRAIAACKAGA